MAESLFNSLLFTLERGATSQIAQKLGEPEAAVSRGLESSIATVLAGLSTKADDPGMLRRILDMVPAISGGWSAMAGQFTNASSTILAGGKRILSTLFGNSEGPITNAIGHEAGLGVNSVSTLLSMAAPMVMGFLSNKIRDGSMTVNGIASTLSSESSALRRALPAGAADLIWRRTETPSASPVVAQSVRRESTFPWAGALALGALALGVLWLFTHNRAGQIATGAANRIAGEGSAAREAVNPTVPRVDLKLPDAGEGRLLSFARGRGVVPATGNWFEFERWRFDTGSAKLRAGSDAQLDDVAAIFKAYPSMHGTVTGYTDSKGSPEANLSLSQARANTVKSELIARGVPEECLSTQGMGQDNAVADNSTETGRANNRRVALLITRK
jgi:outer membrane protein OmpA-like peptidoglycan-associated protein